jgi:hypothetical protein
MPTVLTIPPSHRSNNGEDPRRPVPTLFRTFEASVYCASSIIVIPIGLTSSASAYLKASGLEKKQSRLPPVAARAVTAAEDEEDGAGDEVADAGADAGAVAGVTFSAEAGTGVGVSSSYLASGTSTASTYRGGGGGGRGGGAAATTSTTRREETPSTTTTTTTAPVVRRKRGRPPSTTTTTTAVTTTQLVPGETAADTTESLNSSSLVP